MVNDGGIGTLQERSLHAAIKELYEGSGSQFEVNVDGYIIDVVKDDLLIEIQTSSFSAIKDKLFKLMKDHRVRLVHPIAAERWILRQSPDGKNDVSRRRSPKRKDFANIFEELVSIPTFLIHSNFSLEIILTKEEEIRRKDGKGSWRRRGWSSIDRRLIEIVDRRVYHEPKDFLHLIPDSLERPFTTSQLAEITGIPRRIAQKMTYCLRKMDVLRTAGKKGNAILYVT
ncbi:MAG: hypothetical protein JW779_04055 [Candidatus Thorarchaeota archaeon]|nr:hypothetical protein [Candidatus Thorarchaeota archaeon]